MEGGADVEVDGENRADYVDLLVKYRYIYSNIYIRTRVFSSMRTQRRSKSIHNEYEGMSVGHNRCLLVSRQKQTALRLAGCLIG